MLHAQETGHCALLGMDDLSVWCYGDDDGRGIVYMLPGSGSPPYNYYWIDSKNNSDYTYYWEDIDEIGSLLGLSEFQSEYIKLELELLIRSNRFFSVNP